MPEGAQQITFLVQGSGEQAYKVSFLLSDHALNAFCTCQAGQNGTMCKHRLSILTGSTAGILSNNVHEVEVVVAQLPGTPLAKALDQLVAAEIAAERAKVELASAKKAVARAMHHG